MHEGPLEQSESVDMLRVLENGGEIQGVLSDFESKGVDTPEQVEMIEKLIKNNSEEYRIYQEIAHDI